MGRLLVRAIGLELYPPVTKDLGVDASIRIEGIVQAGRVGFSTTGSFLS